MKIKRIIALAFIAMAGTIASVSFGKSPHSHFYEQRESLFELLPIDSTDIVFLGNSITNGCEWHELLGMPNIKNRGISGDIVGGVDDRLTTITSGHPSKIFLMIGINDVSHGLTADSIATSIVELVNRISAETPTTEIYVQSILPVDSSFGIYKNLTGRDELPAIINSKLAPMIEETGATWINLYPAFADGDGRLREAYTNDGLHLMGEGYLAWRDIILPYLK